MFYNTTKNNDCFIYLLIFEQKIKTYFIMKTKEQILKNEVFKLSNLAGFELEVLDAMEIYKEQAVR